MSIVVRFYSNFNKKINSTAVPPTEGTAQYCTLKDTCSLTHPVLELSKLTVTGYNYCFIPDLGNRYYFIDDWVYDHGLYVAHLRIDVLATYKETIGSKSLYVLRSSATSDKTITDGYYPAKTTMTTKTQEKDFHTDLGWPTSFDLSTGYFVVGVVNNLANVNGSVCYYMMTGSEMAAFRAYMLSAIASWDDITDFSGDVAKAFIDPFQYVVSCMWFPTSPAIGAEKRNISFGFWESDLTASYLTDYTKTYSFSLARPTRDDPLATYPYLHKTPFASYYLFCQPWGAIPLNGDQIAATGIDCVIVFDFITGNAILTVTSKLNGNVLFTGEAPVGVPMQLSNVGFDYKALTSLSSLKASALNSAIAAIAGGSEGFSASNILSSAAAANAEVENRGSNGGMSAVSLGGKATLFAIFPDIVDFDNANNGSPLCQMKRISELSGYVKVMNGNIPVAALGSEREQIKNYLEGGFYYE